MITRLLITAVGILMLVVSTAYASDGAIWIWHGTGNGAPLGVDFHGILGSVGLVFFSANEELPSPGPSVSETPLSESETMLAAFYERALGNVTAGIGVARLKRAQTGTKTVAVDGESQQVFVNVLDDSATSLAAMVRVAIGSGPVFGDAQAIATSKGVVLSARAGWSIEQLRIGVGYQSGITDDWWSGPLIFVGTSW